VIFVQFTEQGGRLSGRMQFFGVKGRAWKVTDADNASFTGVREGESVSLRFAGLFTENIINGTLSGDTLSLVMPQEDGRLAAVEFRRAAVGEYNAEVEKLKGQAAKTNEATRKAWAEEERIGELRGRGARADGTIQDAFESLDDRVGELGDAARFDEQLSGFDEHWREMQEHEKEFKSKAAARPLDNYKLGEARHALQNLGHDRQNIRHDRQSLNYAVKNAEERISKTRDALAALERAWDELQAARNSEAGVYTRSALAEGDVAGLKARAAAEVKKVEGAVGKAEARARGIEQRADETYSKAQVLFDGLKNERE
jgi:chromosome segregation ATPase